MVGFKCMILDQWSRTRVTSLVLNCYYCAQYCNHTIYLLNPVLLGN